ncbi:MAG: transposase [Bifidobacterium sp.]
MVVDHKRERVVRAHDGYGKEALDLFFRQPTDERRASIRIDAGVRKHPPNAGRVLDPFRIVSRMSDALDQVCRRLRNQARRGNESLSSYLCLGCVL